MSVPDLAVFDLHGEELAYVDVGDGPPVVLIHGLMSSHRTWSDQIERLAGKHRVVAPDLPGHGESGKAMGDYSLSAHAAAIRDLADHLGIDSATIVGHSLGGGIAMQFAYLFPTRVDRLALVSSGGFGREINPLLRAASLPGSEYVLPVITAAPVRQVGGAVLDVWSRLGLPRFSASSMAAWTDLGSLADTDTRRAFLATSRSVIDAGGQTVNASSRISVLADRPVLGIWGARDRIIPATHVERLLQALPGGRTEIFAQSGHFPHLDEPELFAQVLSGFVDETPLRVVEAG